MLQIEWRFQQKQMFCLSAFIGWTVRVYTYTDYARILTFSDRADDYLWFDNVFQLSFGKFVLSNWTSLFLLLFSYFTPVTFQK